MFRFTQDDRAFVADIDARFPEKGIANSGEGYLAIPKPHRLAKVWEDAGKVKRAGYVRRGVPDDRQQSNRNHCHWVAQLAVAFNPLGMQVAQQQMREMAVDHDLPEVVFNADFTTADMGRITQPEKFRLERLGAGLLFSPARFARWEEQEARQTPRAAWIGDCDRLEVCLDAVCVVEQKYPTLKKEMEGFFLDLEEFICTDRGKKISDELIKSREALHRTGECLGLRALRGDTVPQEETPWNTKMAEIKRIKRVLAI